MRGRKRYDNDRQNAWNRSPDGLAAARVRSATYKQKRSAENRRRLHELKSEPCTDCGGTFDPVCMDFDHRPGETKVAAVGAMVSHYLLEIVLAEVAKCDLVCANCHRIRTHRKRDHKQLVKRTAPQSIARQRRDDAQLGLSLPKDGD